MIPFAILAIEDSDDRDFMEHLYTNYQRLMYSEIRKIISDHLATEDLLHSVIVKLIDKISLLRSLTKAKLINYIITTCRNTALNYLRDTKKSTEYSYDDKTVSIVIIRNRPNIHMMTILTVLRVKTHHWKIR